MVIFASDLDNTLIYSHKYMDKENICVETKLGKELSFMSVPAYNKLQRIARKLCFIPVTTRSLEQYERITLLKQGNPPYALVSNGGILLENGIINQKWLKETKEMIRPSMAEIKKAFACLEQDEALNFDIRDIDGMFLFTKSSDPVNTVNILKAKLDLTLVDVVRNENKVYVLPSCLNKGLAIRRLRQLLRPCTIISAGDSSFDLPMLVEADRSIAYSYEIFGEGLQYNSQAYFWNKDKLGFADYVLDQVQYDIN